MVTTKYTEDYRLENVLDKKSGKLVTKAVYRGDWFWFDKDMDLVKRRRVLFTALSGLIAVLFVVALMLTGFSERNTEAIAINQMYVLLPFVGLLFPIYFLLAATVRFWQAKEKVTRAHRDRIIARYTSSSISVIFLAGASLVGHIVSWIRNGETMTDIVLLVITVVILASGIIMFVFHNDLSMEKVGTAKIDYPDEPPVLPTVKKKKNKKK